MPSLFGRGKPRLLRRLSSVLGTPSSRAASRAASAAATAPTTAPAAGAARARPATANNSGHRAATAAPAAAPPADDVVSVVSDDDPPPATGSPASAPLNTQHHHHQQQQQHHRSQPQRHLTDDDLLLAGDGFERVPDETPLPLDKARRLARRADPTTPLRAEHARPHSDSSVASTDDDAAAAAAAAASAAAAAADADAAVGAAAIRVRDRGTSAGNVAAASATGSRDSSSPARRTTHHLTFALPRSFSFARKQQRTAAATAFADPKGAKTATAVAPNAHTPADSPTSSASATDLIFSRDPVRDSLHDTPTPDRKTSQPVAGDRRNATFLRLPRSSSAVPVHAPGPVAAAGVSNAPGSRAAADAAATAHRRPVPRSASLFIPRPLLHKPAAPGTPPPEEEVAGASVPRSSSLFLPHQRSSTAAPADRSNPSQNMASHNNPNSDRIRTPLPRSASLFTPRSQQAQLAQVPTSCVTVGHRESGVPLARQPGSFVPSHSFSPRSAPFPGVTDSSERGRRSNQPGNVPKSMSANFSIPTGWPGQQAPPSPPSPADLKKKREEERLAEARRQVHKLDPDDPDFRKRRRTPAVNLYSTFKEEVPVHAAEFGLYASPRRSEAGGPGFGFGKRSSRVLV